MKRTNLFLFCILLICSQILADGPNVEFRTYDEGSLYLTISNMGFFGSQRGNDNPYKCIRYDSGPWAGTCRPSAEYPGESGIEHLFQGAFWIGGVVVGDTLVSVGEDGWFDNINELFPGYDSTDKRNNIQEFSTDSGDAEALANQTFWTFYTDTVINPDYIEPGHKPMGIEVFQKSHQWADSSYGNFVIFEVEIKNISSHNIEDIFFGIYIDGDIGHIDSPNYCQDDITGYIGEWTNTSVSPPENIPVNVGWIADNDGDPEGDSVFGEYSCPAALGVVVLGCFSESNPNYNWWVSHTNESSGGILDHDWGPYQTTHNYGWDGTPENDKCKYELLSCDEIDFDQNRTLEYRDSSDWIVPNDTLWLKDLADGYDTRFLFSFGPFDLSPDGSVEFAFAVIAVPGFHTIGGGYNYDAVAEEAIKVKEFYCDLVGIGEAPIHRPILDLQVYPNPFNSTVRISLDYGSESAEPLSASPPGACRVEIFDINGRMVYAPSPSVPLPMGEGGKTLLPPGEGGSKSRMRAFIWTPDESLPSGVYLVRATMRGDLAVIKRVVYLK